MRSVSIPINAGIAPIEESNKDAGSLPMNSSSQVMRSVKACIGLPEMVPNTTRITNHISGPDARTTSDIAVAIAIRLGSDRGFQEVARTDSESGFADGES